MKQILFILCCFSTLSFPQNNGVTLEWMLSDKPKAIEATPQYEWLNDGTALLFDDRLPEEERTFERLDPQRGKREPLLDPQLALATLQPLLGDEAPESLSWPLMFDRAGAHALYTFENDVFMLDVAAAEFQRITQTDAEEKAPTLAPDGSRVAFVRDNDLYTYDLTRGAEQRHTHDGSETLLNGVPSWVYWEEIFDRQDQAYWWSPDARAIAFLQSDESQVGVMSHVDFEPQLPQVLTQRYPKAGQTNPTVRLGIVSLDDNAITWAKLPNEFEYIVRVVWLPQGDRVAVLTLDRAQRQLDMFLVDRATGESQRILRETEDTWVDYYEPFFLPDGEHFIWTSERSGYAHLYRYTLDGELVNPITSGNWSVLPFGMFSSGESQVLAVDDDQWVYFLSNKDASIERQLYRCKLEGGSVMRVSSEAGVHNPAFSPDGRYYLDRQSSATQLPSVSLHKNDGTRLHDVAPARMALLDSLNIQYPEFLAFPAADRFPLPAMMFKPKDFDPEKTYPVILYVYGGPSAPRIVNQWLRGLYFYQLLLQEGYVVMSVDNRASAYIGKEIVEAIYGQVMGDVEVNDLADAVRAIGELPYVDAQRIGIYGASGGGMYTLLAMTRTELFKAGISRAPVTDWRYYDTKFTELIMKRPQDNPEGYEQTSLVAAAPNLHGRLLLIHGTYDDNVHIQNTWAFANELIKAGKLFDMMIYPMRKHSITDDAARQHLYRLMLEFWKTNL